MKNKFIRIIELSLFFCLGIFVGLNLYDRKDVNRDRKITAVDYAIIKNYIMNKEVD